MSTGEVPFDAFTMDDIDADEIGRGGSGSKLPGGGYRLTIMEAVVDNGHGSTQIECEVEAAEAENAAMVGRIHIEKLKWPKAKYSDVGNRIAREQLLAWCFAAKTLTRDKFKALQQAGQKFETIWLEAMAGVSVLVFIKREKYKDTNDNDAISAKIEGRVWAIDDPERKGMPGWVDPAVAATPAAAAPQQQAPPAAQQSPATALADFSKLV